MKHPVIILAAALAVGSAAVAVRASAAGAPQRASGAGIVHAHADITGEGISGTADFTESQQATGTLVTITVTVKGLKPGMHGVHLHAVGKCTPDFAAAGGHFDPGPAGNPDPDANHPYHMGDLPQLAVTGPTATMRVATTRVTLSDGPLSLFDADGSAIVIHGNPDQGITGEPKSGVSGGPRLACGVIEKK
ncbi:MAG TPA: superoxide dismutase family protein [Vicinamibacterales bacterium]|jgi:Cu-Zn family superoxide dismutase|nr:superoxide dismutase family protein [Vicinamibacterales bacterium]